MTSIAKAQGRSRLGAGRTGSPRSAWPHRLAAAICALLALQAAAPVAAQTPSGSGAGRLTVETAEFVVSLTDGEGERRSIASTLVPYLPNQACFGWRIRLAAAPAVVRLREVLQLPAAPAFWSNEDDAYSPHRYSADRKTAITEQFAAPQDGWIASSWCIVEGDPVGAHSIEVFIDDRLIRRFDFEVRRPTKGYEN
jgi:hypothetical protein